ncbi:putative ATP-binding protein [Pseudomonas savastanoi pv. phaseolicola]|uniref:AAA family ATPase n=1 Tax=Pseudomonas savastanoi TaxID=29438 RepID=UPI0006B88D1D|nr:ATP-binding protein [Pseudomonas savastanoi]KPB38076.1 putative ATP-binding protein [Pseudomonas savastanoi pv. phaseolicola]RMV41549.1 putative ATP-binding protein [Pseudomonas savastanoi pv. phaseolicola]
MLKTLSVKNLTVFRELNLTCSPGLNVIVGENGMGKTHLLKVAYALIATSAEAAKKANLAEPTKTYLQKAYADKLTGVFRPESVGRLARRKQGRGRCEISLAFDDSALDTRISFATSAKTDVQIEKLSEKWDEQSPLYLPTRELLTIFPGFVSVYEGHYLEFEETWRDTCLHLGSPTLKGPREKWAAQILEPIEQALGGKVVLDNNGRFYLNVPGRGSMEMPLVAEGLRKLAMLARLIATGSVLDKGYLFWDEPEANLNPRLIRLVASVIHALSSQGVQVFIATHSFFLLKELDLLSRQKPFPLQYWGLKKEESADGVSVEQADVLNGLSKLVMLDEELAQYDRELDIANG